MATLMPSPLTGDQTNSQSWLASIGVGRMTSSQRFQFLPMPAAKFSAPCQLCVRLARANRANSIPTMRHANTSVPFIGFIQLLYRNSMANSTLDATAASTPLAVCGIASDGIVFSGRVLISMPCNFLCAVIRL